MAVNLNPYSRAKWRERGYRICKLETVNAFSKIVRYNDFFGFGDLAAVKEGELVIIQITSRAGIHGRVTKMREETTGDGQWEFPIREAIRLLLSVPGIRIVIDGWYKEKNRRKCREVEITNELLDQGTGTILKD